MKNKIVFASNNSHKLNEVRSMIQKFFEVRGLKDIGCYEDIPETSDTLEGNALLKAEFVSDKFNINCFADDTGLEVEALNGHPGVYSARYAGPDCSPENNMKKLLEEMEGETNRKARFRTVIASIINGETTNHEGIVEGEITLEKSGAEGFGYDPIFKPEGYNITFAEMGMEEKNKISHRARALRKFVQVLSEKS